MSDDDPFGPDWGTNKPPASPASRPAGRAGYAHSPAKPRISETDPGPRRARKRSSGVLPAFLSATSLPVLGAAFLLVLGLGLRRDLPPNTVVAGAVFATFMPVLAIAGSLRFRRGALGLAGWFWCGLLLAGLPQYFPADRVAALGEGAAWLALPVGDERATAFGRMAEDFGDLAWGPDAQPGRATAGSLPVAPELPARPPRQTAEASPDEEPNSARIILPVEGQGHTLKVDVGFEGPAGRRDTSVLFDTGATFTTLDRQTLAALGVVVPADAPTARFQTANGEMESPMVLLDRVWLGDTKIEKVTIAVCEACSQNGSAGLLGLNVTGQFQTTFDPELQEVVLMPREDSGNRHLDIAHWLKIEGTAHTWPTGRVEVDVKVRNNAPYEVAQAVVEVECAENSFAVQLDAIPAGQERSTRVELPRRTNCSGYKLILRSAGWK